MPRIVYSRNYNIGFYGLERLHPFDSRKYGRAWRLLRRHFGTKISRLHVRPRRAASDEEITLVHSNDYLSRLRNPKYVASALEVPQIQRLPRWAIDWHVLRPMSIRYLMSMRENESIAISASPVRSRTPNIWRNSSIGCLGFLIPSGDRRSVWRFTMRALMSSQATRLAA